MNPEQLQVIIEEARRNEASLPIRRRVVLYRGLANLCGDLLQNAELQKLANELEQADQRCQQFQFRFQTPSADQMAKMAV